jgi:hypothetical protein
VDFKTRRLASFALEKDKILAGSVHDDQEQRVTCNNYSRLLIIFCEDHIGSGGAEFGFTMIVVVAVVVVVHKRSKSKRIATTFGLLKLSSRQAEIMSRHAMAS